MSPPSGPWRRAATCRSMTRPRRPSPGSRARWPSITPPRGSGSMPCARGRSSPASTSAAPRRLARRSRSSRRSSGVARCSSGPGRRARSPPASSSSPRTRPPTSRAPASSSTAARPRCDKTPQCSRAEEMTWGGNAMALDRPQLVQMLRTMILIREFDERAIQLRVAGKIYGAVHPYVGQEAVAVGVCSNLTVSDRVTSTHRGHGHCIAKGADIRRMMAELFGRVDGYCKGKGGSMHIADFAVGMLGANGIVGGGLPIACGAALAGQLEGKGAVTVCFFGDGAAAEGEFHESLNIASLWKLPIVFVCENNQYAANNAVGVQHPSADIATHAVPFGIPGVGVDGNDVLAVHAAPADAVTRARRGDGPSLLECKTYRWHFHAMRAARPPETRPAEEIASWKAGEPIARLEQHMVGRALLSPEELRAIRDRVGAELDDAVAFAEASPFPDPKDLMADMFAR